MSGPEVLLSPNSMSTSCIFPMTLSQTVSQDSLVNRTIYRVLHPLPNNSNVHFERPPLLWFRLGISYTSIIDGSTFPLRTVSLVVCSKIFLFLVP